MSNVDIAHNYAKMVRATLEEGGVWGSTLHNLPRGERKAIVKIYKKYFSKVEVNGLSVLCYK